MHNAKLCRHHPVSSMRPSLPFPPFNVLGLPLLLIHTTGCLWMMMSIPSSPYLCAAQTGGTVTSRTWEQTGGEKIHQTLHSLPWGLGHEASSSEQSGKGPLILTTVPILHHKIFRATYRRAVVFALCPPCGHTTTPSALSKVRHRNEVMHLVALDTISFPKLPIVAATKPPFSYCSVR